MIVLYVLKNCPYCNNSLKVLKENNIKYKEIVVENTEEQKKIYKLQSGMNTFPQIFVKVNKNNFIKIGGNDDLEKLISKCKDLKKTGISIDAVHHMYKFLYEK